MTQVEDGAGTLSGPLPPRVRSRVVEIAAEALGRLAPDQVPGALARVASFAPARRAKVAGDLIATVLDSDEVFRGRVAEEARSRAGDLAHRLQQEGGAPPAADPVEVAALAYLIRPPRWVALVDSATAALSEESRGLGGERVRQGEQLRRQVEALTKSLGETRARHREQLNALKAENSELRRKLGDVRNRLRGAEEAQTTAERQLQGVRAEAEATVARHDAELRRHRQRVEELELELAASRRSVRAERGGEALRARLLLDTLLDTAQGLRRELALPAVEGSPADTVEAHLADEGGRAQSGHGSLGADDPTMLRELLTLPRVHLIVDGYNVTKAAWPHLSLERQRERILGGVAPLAARFGVEVSVVFDAADLRDRPAVGRQRGVRVLFSPAGVIADDVIRDLVAAEPRGRPVVVVSSDAEVVRDVRRAGARPVGAPALVGLLAPG